ncbi:uncharacterized protein HGUI_02355 [Hanseniaspora guilliermondii]|uniref:EF-hand domain-containing protein n=1 Tax=Hanseniaspora guilliermondii TaxID=56406 RepID=A0A1L0B535_9ASCO|nr:uncharacterized protein HGUI_02355 [Hanseniaspora guilliermondii]
MEDNDLNKSCSEDNDSCKDLFNKIINTKTEESSNLPNNGLVSKRQFHTYIQDSNQLFKYVNANEINIENNLKQTMGDIDEKHKQIVINKNLINKISTNYLNDLFFNISQGEDTFDYNKFQTYYNSTINEIKKGFYNIDLDKDGFIKLQDINKYLTNLDIIKQNETVNKPSFLRWVKNKKPDALPEEPGYDQDYKISYKEWESFLIFVPRHNNSRLRTALNIYSNINQVQALTSNTDILNRFKMDEDLELDQLTTELGKRPVNKGINMEGHAGITDTKKKQDATIAESTDSTDTDATFKEHFNKDSLKYFLAGGSAGVISRTCTAPFDRIKVFLIANDKTLHVSQVLRTIYKKAGLKGFYVGNGLSAMKIFPESAIKFGSFELVKKLIFPNSYQNMKDNPLGNYLCGGIAGCMAQLFVYPIDTIKYRMQCEDVKYSSPNSSAKSPISIKKIIKETYKQHNNAGIRNFYRGLPAGLTGMFPYAAIDLGTFNLLKNIASQYYFTEDTKIEDRHLPNMVMLPLGAISGSIGASIVYPINLLRTRLQAQGTFAHKHTYNGFFDCASKTVKREGFKGLYKGLLPNLVKVCPSVAISYFCYENFKRLLNLNA